MKKFISICISLLMTVSIAFYMPASASADETTAFKIKIVHTNDIHARITENAQSGIIGAEKLASIIEAYSEDADIDLVLDSGDTFHGQSIATLVQGESVAKLLAACGYDAMTPGNHDWNYGKDRLCELADIAELKMLAGNVVNEDGSRFFSDEFYIEEVTKNGNTLKVGIFGVIDPQIYSSTAPSNVAGLTFGDSVEYSKKAASELKDQGCDIIIALSHTYDPEELAAKVNGVDLWLCGHEHIDIDSTVTTPDGSKAFVVEGGYYMNHIGLIELDCEIDGDGNISELKFNNTVLDYEKASSYENNSTVTALLEEINVQQGIILNRKVGSSPVLLEGTWENLRIDETNLGKAVTSAYILVTGADIAFENAGGIRASIEAGDVTYGDIISVSPYGNYIVTKQISGAQLKEILEISIDIQLQSIAANDSGDYNAWPQSSGSYLQTGGMTVTYNPALEKGKRVISVKIGKESLDKNKMYTVATNNYIAVSSDYPQLANASKTGEFCACDEALIKFFEQSDDIIAASVAERGMLTTNRESNTSPYTIFMIKKIFVALALAAIVVLLIVKYCKKKRAV